MSFSIDFSSRHPFDQTEFIIPLTSQSILPTLVDLKISKLSGFETLDKRRRILATASISIGATVKLFQPRSEYPFYPCSRFPLFAFFRSAPFGSWTPQGLLDGIFNDCLRDGPHTIYEVSAASVTPAPLMVSDTTQLVFTALYQYRPAGEVPPTLPTSFSVLYGDVPSSCLLIPSATHVLDIPSRARMAAVAPSDTLTNLSSAAPVGSAPPTLSALSGLPVAASGGLLAPSSFDISAIAQLFLQQTAASIQREEAAAKLHREVLAAHVLTTQAKVHAPVVSAAAKVAADDVLAARKLWERKTFTAAFGASGDDVPVFYSVCHVTSIVERMLQFIRDRSAATPSFTVKLTKEQCISVLTFRWYGVLSISHLAPDKVIKCHSDLFIALSSLAVLFEFFGSFLSSLLVPYSMQICNLVRDHKCHMAFPLVVEYLDSDLSALLHTEPVCLDASMDIDDEDFDSSSLFNFGSVSAVLTASTDRPKFQHLLAKVSDARLSALETRAPKPAPVAPPVAPRKPAAASPSPRPTVQSQPFDYRAFRASFPKGDDGSKGPCPWFILQRPGCTGATCGRHSVKEAHAFTATFGTAREIEYRTFCTTNASKIK